MKLAADLLLWIDDDDPPRPLASALSEAGITVRSIGAEGALEAWRTAVRSEDSAPAILVLGARVQNRLALARTVHGAAPGAHLVFLVERDDAEGFRQAIARSALIGAHWTVASGPPTALLAQVRAAVRSTRQRLSFRASLDRINDMRRAGTERDDVPRGLVVTNHFLASILEHAEDGILAIERDDTIATWNQGAARLFGREVGAVLGHPIDLLVDPAHAAELVDLVHGARRGRTVRNHEMPCRRSDGTTFHASITLAPVRDEMDRIPSVSLMVRDDTARRRHEDQIQALNAELAQRLRDVHEVNAELASTLATLERMQGDLLRVNRSLEEQATTDPLTGLKNRIVFQNSLQEMIHVAERQRTPLSLLLIDVDHFKRVNDTFGHLEGDRALRAVASALTRSVREQDIVARFGGEEFAVLLPNTSLADASIVAEHVRSGCCGVFDLEPALTISIGVAALAPGEPEASLIGRADAALYASKAQGRDRVTVAEAVDSTPAGGRPEPS